MRALLRPASMHDITLDGLARSRRRKSIASPLVNPSWIVIELSHVRALQHPSQSSSADSLRVSDMRNPASMRRALFSARSI